MQVDAAVLAEIGLLYLRNKNLEAQLETFRQRVIELTPKPEAAVPIESCQ